MTCPSEEQLAGYLLESQAPDLASVREHVVSCARCQAWIDEVRQEDDDLQHVRRVLVQERTVSSSGQSSTSIAVGAADMTTLSVGAMVSPSPDFQEYEILQELGRGGMGAVYLATQKSTKRKVALKVLLEGPFASATSKRRFEREVELAAQLQHPHIVTILESGISSGRYYFAMQYVEGERLDVHLAGKKQTIVAMLRLFQQVCEAVSYAHQHGVMHRDLKPSNLLVDGAGEPHVLDFGLAKVADPSAEPELLALSMTGQLMGTLPYMSPEQAQGLHHDLDIRTDVYSLGVILYEMLTRKFPYPVTGKISEILKNISETAPHQPSLVDARIDNEVETIVLKALSKERERRYQSAGELARDLGHYLAGEPIEAKRDSTVYVLRKMLRRYRVPVAAMGVFALVLLFSAFGLTAQRARLRESRAVAQASDLLSTAMYNPALVVSAVKSLDPNVRRHFSEMVSRYLQSSAYPERVMGSRIGLLVRPEVFWQSVDGGPLWRYGEWLEVAQMPWVSGPGEEAGAGRPPAELIASLIERARSGSDRQKYVSLCLLGRFHVAEAGDVVAENARNATHPGVASAALWAAGQIGRKIQPVSSQSLYVDELTGLTFARVPGCEGFRRGSDRSDPDRFDDEDQPEQPVPIHSMLMSTTEVTLAALEPFFKEFQNDPNVFGSEARGTVENGGGLPRIMAETSAAERPQRTANFVSWKTGKKYCDWLNERGRERRPRPVYRLPSEDEWEWACRAGNNGRFCYGDDAKYVTLFARCNGYAHEPRVAECMPNYYGLFDMHGGLWEACDSEYHGQDGRSLPLYVLRGGADYSPAVRCRCAQRNYASHDAENDHGGVRIIMELMP